MRSFANIVARLVLWASAAAVLFPILWVVLTAFKPAEISQALPPVWDFRPTLDNFHNVLVGATYTSQSFGVLIVHSFVVTFASGRSPRMVRPRVRRLGSFMPCPFDESPVSIAHGSGVVTPVGRATVRTTVWQVGRRAESLATFCMPGRRDGVPPHPRCRPPRRPRRAPPSQRPRRERACGGVWRARPCSRARGASRCGDRG